MKAKNTPQLTQINIASTPPRRSELLDAKPQDLPLIFHDALTSNPRDIAPTESAPRRPRKKPLSLKPKPPQKPVTVFSRYRKKGTMPSTEETRPPCNDKANDAYPDWQAIDEYPPKAPAEKTHHNTGLGLVMNTVLMILLKGYGR